MSELDSVSERNGNIDWVCYTGILNAVFWADYIVGMLYVCDFPREISNFLPSGLPEVLIYLALISVPGMLFISVVNIYDMTRSFKSGGRVRVAAALNVLFSIPIVLLMGIYWVWKGFFTGYPGI